MRQRGLSRDETKVFARRLHWRDLAYFQLYSFPDMTHFPIRRHYAAHRWAHDEDSIAAGDGLRRWKRGLTGYPMVDAGMRCLYATGWMHQSVRLFLV